MNTRKPAPTPETLFNERAEQYVLAAILMEPNAVGEISLTPRMFGLEKHSRIFAAMLKLTAQNTPPTFDVLTHQLEAEGTLPRVGGLPYLAALAASAPSPAFIQTEARLVERFYVLRELALASGEIAAIAYDSKDIPTPREILEAARTRLDAVKLPTAAKRNNLPATWADMENSIAPIVWDWDEWLPRGFPTLVVGESGQGKSIILLYIVGCFLRGDPFPDGKHYTGEDGLVLWCETEAAQGLNLQRAREWGFPLEKIITPFDDPFLDVKLDKSEHRKVISERLHHPKVRVMVIDSLRGAHGGDENASEMFEVGKFLAELARDTVKPMMISHHLNKPNAFNFGGAVTLDRVRGSSAITQTARVIWAIDTPNLGTPTKKRLAVIKSNLGRFPEPLGFEISEEGLVFTDAPRSPKSETIVERAKDVLLLLLDNGPKPATMIQTEIEQAGLSWQAAKRAKEQLGVVSVKPGGVWHWSLPAREG